jgi:hypothetical protein
MKHCRKTYSEHPDVQGKVHHKVFAATDSTRVGHDLAKRWFFRLDSNVFKTTISRSIIERMPE